MRSKNLDTKTKRISKFDKNGIGLGAMKKNFFFNFDNDCRKKNESENK